MKEIIPVSTQQIGENTAHTVNARDLHAFLEVGKDFSTWIQDRIRQFEFVKNQDFIIFPEIGENSKVGRPSKEYALTLDMAKELSMVERTTKGKEARQYFIECERRLREPATGSRMVAMAEGIHHALTDPDSLRILLLKYTERVLALEASMQEQAPKVAFHDAVCEAINGQTVQEIAKVLGMGPNRMFQTLREDGLLMRNNLPYQQYIDAGYFRVVEKAYKDKHNEVCTYARTLVTGKGLTYIQKRIQGLQTLLTLHPTGKLQ
ncbi:antA/AntB antirepressor family protein [Acidithiobacillus montserratensis]|uniref:AntA/AntB antirepressor family protein n=1 Tax=Acidithiobacillus montserratensis TaxID=2729135 RepID=A0ACD5HJZ8_9PROT|nr:phage antirepressor KilAC domain-containing protein [Acidithiobacillus montserratensis]MBU2748626.1 phage antirepressor Ant [Acidithiobacillus montserratensis]